MSVSVLQKSILFKSSEVVIVESLFRVILKEDASALLISKKNCAQKRPMLQCTRSDC